ncbi:hypothetical protein H7F33_19610 [Pedobacter sp. PAMC26386]|nr:hypothetical protein H7F33_19610 [Pedobacter sp. PAMC26386]
MYKLTLLFLMTPLLTFAQSEKKEGLYLDSKNEITTTKSEFKCVKNEELSREFLWSYDCLDSLNQVVKQLNINFHIPDAIKRGINPVYLRHTNQGDYLIGDFKDGRPYNGFFRYKIYGSEWSIYDYYQEGSLTQQWYNDFYNMILSEQDNNALYGTLDAKNTFIDGALENGIEITPAYLQQKHAMAEVIRTVRAAKTELFRVIIMAENAVVLLKVTPSVQGYLLEEVGKSSIRITFTPEGRKIETITPDKKSKKVTEYVYYAFSAQDQVDKNRPYSYFQKNNKLYIEQAKHALTETNRYTQESSRMMEMLSLGLYETTPFETSSMLDFLQGQNETGGYMGSSELYEGKLEGFVYKPGDTETTYTMDYYSRGKIQPAKVLAKNKTLKELTEILKSYY